MPFPLREFRTGRSRLGPMGGMGKLCLPMFCGPLVTPPWANKFAHATPCAKLGRWKRHEMPVLPDRLAVAQHAKGRAGQVAQWHGHEGVVEQ